MQIVMLALAFAGVVAAKIYVDKYLAAQPRPAATVSDAQEPGTVSLPEPKRTF
jgi:hypothetical protein